MSQQNKILLESDTNELELVEFRIDEVSPNGAVIPCYYGVNVAKVREIIRCPKLSGVVNAPPAVAGMMKLREKIITVIDLSMILNKDIGDMKADRVIVLEFNSVTIGVLVHSVSRIYRISWRNVEPPSRLTDGSQITGMVKMEDRIILVLDFEKIVGELCHDSALKPLDGAALDSQQLTDRSGFSVLVADDSSFIRNIMVTALRGAGYQVEEATDGEEAWEMISRRLTAGTRYDLLITDVEMPQMDGLHLTSLVRKEPFLAGMPVVIFSSLASEGNRRKWMNLGANYILTKPELPRLVEVAGELTTKGTVTPLAV
jgi:two-component system, chemotaxis family, chemotaxis protein CheV